ncbi:MAG: phage portal protein [Candidatus Methylomirabilales bacterium]
MTVLGGILERRASLERPSIPLSAANIVEYLGGGARSHAGIDVTQDSALRNMAVWRAVNLLSSRIASLPLKAYRNLGDNTRVEVTDQLALFMGEAYPDLTWYEYLETTLVHLLLWGNAYTLKIRNEAGDKILRVLPIEPSRVEVTRGPSSAPNPSGKMFRIAGISAEPLTPAEIMHIPGLGYDGLVGLSPIAYAREAIGVAVAAEEVAAKMYDSGLLNAGYIQAEVDLTDEEAAKVKQRWRERVAGVVRSYEVAVLATGLKYMPATIPPKDAQWIEARQFGVQEIARLYGIDPDHLMENSSTGNTNTEQRAINLVKFAFPQWITRVEKRMSVHLAPRATFVEFSVDALLRGDALSRAQVYTAALGGGWMTINEVRDLENLPMLEDLPDEPVEEPESEEEPEEEEMTEEEEPEPESVTDRTRILRDFSGQVVGFEPWR